MYRGRVGSPYCPHRPKCGDHLFVVCPDGWTWDIDSRVPTCSVVVPHHCWSWHGEPPNVTVGLGDCRNGGGSIKSARGGHWWLIDGAFIEAKSGETHPIDGT